MRVLILGCGYTGITLGRQLAARGDQAIGLRRQPEVLPDEIERIRGDLSDPRTVPRIAGPLDAIVFMVSAGARNQEAYRQAYVDSVLHSLQCLREAGQEAPRWIHVSSTGVYGTDDGSWVDEDTPPEAASDIARILLESEALPRDWPGGCVVARLSGIYGPGRCRIVDQVSRQQPLNPALQDRWLNHVHVHDAAAALLHLVDLPDPDPLYLVSDDEPERRKVIVEWLADELGQPLPPMGEAGGSARGGNKRCANRRLRGSGFAFRYPSYREGYLAVAAEDGID